MASEVADFLSTVCAELAEQGTTSLYLVALVFDPESTQIDVLTREQPHVEQYPELETILTGIGRNCTEDGIGVDQLRRIMFFEEVSHCGGPATRLHVYVY
jgi:hypothetical protein